MHISENVLDKYIEIMCMKLEVKTSSQLLEEAAKEGLI
jgi:DNA-binding CsgD family transcriptional regulator